MLLRRALTAVMFVLCTVLYMFHSSPQIDLATVSPPARIVDPLDQQQMEKEKKVAVAAPGTLLNQLEVAEGLCNADVRNNLKRHTGCILLRDVVVDGDVFHYKMSQNPHAPVQKGPFPSVGKTRHHMAPVTLAPLSDSLFGNLAKNAAAGETVAYYQSPVSGAMWVNMWHTIADFFVMVYHTVGPLLQNDVQVHYLTKTAKATFGKLGCSSPSACEAMSLFDPFKRLFNNSYSFLGARKATRYKFLLLGLNTRCSPIPTEHVGVPTCQQNLRSMRNTLLKLYGLDPGRTVTEKETNCPLVHLMSRQKDKYRRIAPFPKFVDELRAVLRARGCPEDNIRVISLHGGIPFAKQLEYINNHTILLAGRGGGTALCPFLPVGGGYLSISGFDRWNPFRDLIPDWITLQHEEVSLVHHEDPEKPPQKFCSKGNCYVDPNRAGYKVDPTLVAVALGKLMTKLDKQNRSSS